MALLSSRGIDTQSLQARGEQRRSIYFNNDRDIPTFTRNEHAHALHARAGNASVAIRVDTRPKAVKPKKGKGSYRRAAAVNGADADCRR
jgi:hypothetical protein